MARNRAQSGNVFFLLLMGIVLFAAVSMAIVQTSGGGKDISREKSRLLAESVMRYAREAKDATGRLYRQGVSEADLRFAHPSMATDYGTITTTPENQVFDESGGGLPYAPPPFGAAGASSNWEVYGTSAIAQVGTAEADLVLVLRNVDVKVCRQINALNGYDEAATIPTDSYGDGKCIASSTASDRFIGTFSSSPHSPGTTGLVSIPAYQACVNCQGVYSYYNVLIER